VIVPEYEPTTASDGMATTTVGFQVAELLPTTVVAANASTDESIASLTRASTCQGVNTPTPVVAVERPDQ
jgi:hypothetical protein